MPPAPSSNYTSFGMYSGMPSVIQGPGFFPEPSRSIPTSAQPVQPNFSPIRMPSTAAVTPAVSTQPTSTASPDKKLPKTPDAIASSTSHDSTADSSQEPASTPSPKINEESKPSESTHDEIETKLEKPEEKKAEEEDSNKGENSKKDTKTNRSNQHQNYNRRQFSG